MPAHVGPLRVLITNNTLDARAGTELYVYDLAVALLARGHQPVAYSNRLGQVASELRSAGVQVVDRLDSVTEAPDVIHGHHHLDAMTALLHFPQTPAILFCHSSRFWEEMPVHFPRIRRYLAMNEPTYNRLTREHSVQEAKVEWFPNFVDLSRFQPRSPLPERPTRALVFSNYATEAGYPRLIREACDRVGIELTVVGLGVGHSVSQPWELLRDYDLVFASGRCALEAVATGTAVIVCNHFGLGPMVTAGDLDRLRRLNFGAMSTIGQQFDVDDVLVRIGHYSATDAAEASSRVRASAGLDATVDRMLGLYHSVIAEHQESPTTADEESRAAATYLSQISDRVKASAQFSHELDVERAEHHQLRHWHDVVQAEKHALYHLRLELQARHDELSRVHEFTCIEMAAMKQTVTWRARQRLTRIKFLMRIRRLAWGRKT